MIPEQATSIGIAKRILVEICILKQSRIFEITRIDISYSPAEARQVNTSALYLNPTT